MNLTEMSHINEGSILDWSDILKYDTKIPVLEQIKKGSKSPCVFAPFMGEFGFFINTFTRFVHYFNCPKKIVCCRPGEEVFFPSADEFYYDWQDFQEDKDKIGANIPAGDVKYRNLKSSLSAKFLNCNIVEVGHEISYRFVQFMPIELNPFCEPLKYDVIIGPRNRNRDHQRNYPQQKWQEIIDKLVANGYSVGVIGQKSTSYDLKNVSYVSWNHENSTNAMISLLQNCKLFIGTDTGTSHVATMCKCPMLIFRKKDWSTDFIPFMRQQNPNLLFVENGWNNNKEIINKSTEFLKSESKTISKIKKSKQICIHIPLHINSQETRKMLIEKKKLFVDLRALGIDTVFTVDKDEFNSDFSDIPVIDLRDRKSTGIVNPTKIAIDYFHKRHGDECFMLRTGQDVQIDLKGFLRYIFWLISRSFDDNFMAGSFGEWRNDISTDLKTIGMECNNSKIKFIQGNLMSAPIKVWKKYYLILPKTVTHYKDDSITSFLIERDGGKLEEIGKFWKHNPPKYFDSFILKGETIESLYQKEKEKPSDVRDLLPIYEKYAKLSDSIVEFRDEQYISTLSFLSANPKKMRIYNYNACSISGELTLLSNNTDLSFSSEDSLNAKIENFDLIHLDTYHNYKRIYQELELFSNKAQKYILIHDTYTFGDIGDDGLTPGVKFAIDEFIKKNKDGWIKIEESHKSNGLIVLGKSKECNIKTKKEQIKEHHQIHHIGETHKARKRRELDGFFDEFCQGSGLDIGCGNDPITKFVEKWDVGQGDAQYLKDINNSYYDFVYSSHCLEHISNPKEAIFNWWRVLKDEGYLIVAVPHRDLYEKKRKLPSKWNADHKFLFLPDKSESPHTLGLRFLFEDSIKENFNIIYCKVCDDEYISNGLENHSSGEYSIELVVKKKRSK